MIFKVKVLTFRFEFSKPWIPNVEESNQFESLVDPWSSVWSLFLHFGTLLVGMEEMVEVVTFFLSRGGRQFYGKAMKP